LAFQHAIANQKTMSGEVYNVGLSDANVSKWELCEIIQKQLPNFTFMQAEVGVDPDQRNYIVSNEKIESTGFQTKYSLETGIKELIKGYRMIRNTRYGNI
jgi:nucleoside-diphosphate-sugar epimerase